MFDIVIAEHKTNSRPIFYLLEYLPQGSILLLNVHSLGPHRSIQLSKGKAY